MLSINTSSASPCASAPPLDVALLLVGDCRPAAFKRHAQALLDNVVGPLSPDVYAVTDAGGSTDLQNTTVAWALPMLMGVRLQALGLLYGVSEELLAGLRPSDPGPGTLRWATLNRLLLVALQAAGMVLIPDRAASRLHVSRRL